MKALVVGLALVGSGCGPDCYLEVVGGTGDGEGVVDPGETIQFRFCVDDRRLPCGGLWLVNNHLGGSAELGTIDGCGLYAAPPAFPPGLVEVVVEATFPGLDPSGDGCEYAYRALLPAVAPP